MGTDHGVPPSPPRVRHGRSLLRQAVLRRMGPIQALDAQVYLGVNGQAHPRLLDQACKARCCHQRRVDLDTRDSTGLPPRCAKEWRRTAGHHSGCDRVNLSCGVPHQGLFSPPAALHRRSPRACSRQGARQLVVSQRAYLRCIRCSLDSESLLAAGAPGVLRRGSDTRLQPSVRRSPLSWGRGHWRGLGHEPRGADSPVHHHGGGVPK